MIAPAILDIACGPGMQTLELAARSVGPVTAIDLHAPYLAETRRRAASADLSGHICVARASMNRLPFAHGAFDALWCEGALYIMGFERGLTAWKRLLKPGGYVAVSELVLLQELGQTPPEVLAAWLRIPTMPPSVGPWTGSTGPGSR